LDSNEQKIEQKTGGKLGRLWRENWLFLVVIAGIIVGFLGLRTTASAVGSVQEVDAILTNGQPTLVEFYSNT
jgi:uncharacterized membrane-anchored protein YhcB (DUF1043 family)